MDNQIVRFKYINTPTNNVIPIRNAEKFIYIDIISSKNYFKIIYLKLY